MGAACHLGRDGWNVGVRFEVRCWSGSARDLGLRWCGNQVQLQGVAVRSILGGFGSLLARCIQCLSQRSIFCVAGGVRRFCAPSSSTLSCTTDGHLNLDTGQLTDDAYDGGDNVCRVGAKSSWI